MLFNPSQVGIVLSIAAVAKAHFSLSYPNAIGPFSDVDMTKGPCDGYDPTKVTVFQDWPWRGEAVALFTTHPSVVWNFNVALFSDVKNSQSSFIPLTENVKQNNGTGLLCFGQVPGKKEWVGQKAIIQIISNAPDGALTTCMAVTFTDSPPDLQIGGACTNISGPAMAPYDIFFQPGTGSDLNAPPPTSSSTVLTPTSSTTPPPSSTVTSSSSATTSLSSGLGSSSTKGSSSYPTSGLTPTKTGTSTPSGVNGTGTSATSTPPQYTGGSAAIKVGSFGGLAGTFFAVVVGLGI